MTRACLDFFNCAALPAGRFVVALPALRCGSGGYRALTPLAATLLVAYAAAVPAYMAVRLRASMRDTALGSVWAAMSAPFRDEAYWWGLAQTLLRAALVAASVYLRGDDAARFGAMTLLTGAWALLLAQLRPNRIAADNGWELTSLAALTALAVLQSMGAPDGWLAAVALGTGGALVARLGAGGVRRLAAVCGASAAAHDHVRSHRILALSQDLTADGRANGRGSRSAGDYVPLKGV